LRDGRIISHDRRGAEDVLERIDGDDIQRWHIPGTIYEHCLAEHILGEYSLFERDPQEVSRTTQRRLEEVELLLTYSNSCVVHTERIVVKSTQN
jgi:hypothetical protein